MKVCSRLKTFQKIYLRYYATFKVRKLELLFYKTNTFLQKKPTALDIRQSKYSL